MHSPNRWRDSVDKIHRENRWHAVENAERNGPFDLVCLSSPEIHLELTIPSNHSDALSTMLVQRAIHFHSYRHYKIRKSKQWGFEKRREYYDIMLEGLAVV